MVWVEVQFSFCWLWLIAVSVQPAEEFRFNAVDLPTKSREQSIGQIGGQQTRFGDRRRYKLDDALQVDEPKPAEAGWKVAKFSEAQHMAAKSQLSAPVCRVLRNSIKRQRNFPGKLPPVSDPARLSIFRMFQTKTGGDATCQIFAGRLGIFNRYGVHAPEPES